MKNLLNQGISINCLDVNSHTPLIGATIRRQVPAVRFLLANKANPDQAERYSGGTALHKAAAYGASDVLQLLIAAGADVGVRERPPSRATPLHGAYYSSLCVSSLLSCMCRVSSQWHHLISCSISVLAAVRATSLPCCEVLLAAGADPRAEDDSGVSPMILAQDLGFTAAADLFARAPIPAAAEDDDEGATARRDGGLFNCCD